jgi:hypothetical protein
MVATTAAYLDADAYCDTHRHEYADAYHHANAHCNTH